MLHSQIQNLVLKYKSNPENFQQTLILLSGDGNANDDRTSFPEIVTLALENDWNVELWSWKACLSRKFLAIQQEYPSNMKIKYFDQYRNDITFKEKSQQNRQQSTGNDMQSWSFLFLTSFITFIILLIYFFLNINH